MLKLAALASALLCALTVTAEARHRARPAPACVSIFDPCTWRSSPSFAPHRSAPTAKRRRLARHRPALEESYSVPVSGIIAQLAAKVAEIADACGSRVISGVRHTYVAGTRRISLHASGKAVDMAGNPACIYAHLVGWAGGYSTDYARVAHVHISYDPDGGREMGVHFRHGAGRRYARHHHHGRLA